MNTRAIASVLLAASAGMLITACSSSGASGESSAPSKPVTADSARVDLVTANIAGACAQEQYVTCQTMDGSGAFAVMVMGKADIDATFTRLCEALAGPESDPDPETLSGMKIVTDRTTFLVVGETGLQFPDTVDPAAVQKVLGGEVVSMQDICDK